MSLPIPPAVLEEAALHLRAGKYFQLAGYTMLLYDHLITFSDEIISVWQRPLSGVTVLFALNRYVTPLQFAVGVAAFFSPAWSENRPACEHFYRFEGGSTLVMIAICEAIMILRVYALWGRDNRVLALLAVIWITQVVLSGIVNSQASLVPLPPGFVGCIQAGSGGLYLSFWLMPMITDTAVFILTIMRTGYRYTRTPMLERFRRDGVMYFTCIFAANLLNVIFLLTATADLKEIGASFSQLITSVMVSRLILNLRSVGRSMHDSSVGSSRYHVFASTVIGNIGSEVDTRNKEATLVDPDSETYGMISMKGGMKGSV